MSETSLLASLKPSSSVSEPEGSSMAQASLKHGSSILATTLKHGSSILATTLKHGSSILPEAQAFSAEGSSMAQASGRRLKHGSSIYQEAGRRGGLTGGRRRAETLTSEQRREIALKGARVRWAKRAKKQQLGFVPMQHD